MTIPVAGVWDPLVVPEVADLTGVAEGRALEMDKTWHSQGYTDHPPPIPDHPRSL